MGSSILELIKCYEKLDNKENPFKKTDLDSLTNFLLRLPTKICIQSQYLDQYAPYYANALRLFLSVLTTIFNLDLKQSKSNVFTGFKEEITNTDNKRFNEYYTKIENGVEVKGFAIVSPQAGKYKSACRKGLDWTLPTKNPGNNMWIGNLRANGMNYTYIRYADVLLMYAEAVLSGGKQGKLTSLQAVNEVRARKSVNMPALPSVDMKDIEYERILELTGEGHRFYDLLRWGKVASRFHELELSDPNFKQYNTSEYLGFVEGKNEWMPIPVDEVEGNPYITGYNPGWN